MSRIAIVGAGMTGALSALYLARRDHVVDVYEARPDIRTHDITAGRSINLALSTRGLRALDGVGLADTALEYCVPMYGRKIHDEDGGQSFQPYGQADQHINSIDRSALNGLIIDGAEASGQVDFHFESRAADVDLDAPSLTIESEADAPASRTVQPDRLVGADGAYSQVRSAMQRSGRFDYEQSYLSHGYKELTIPAADDGSWRLDDHEALHIWPRKDFMLIALPNPDGSFTCTLFLPFEGPESFDQLSSGADVEAFFDRHFPGVRPDMHNLTDEFFANPTGSMVTIRCEPYHHGDSVILLGDAAHALVPFYGQGMNASCEDCLIFDQLLDEFDDDWSRALPAFSQRRKPDAEAIADLALYNYIEMREHVADEQFLLRKTVERGLERAFPQIWRSLYSMVTFSTIPYAEARQRGVAQSKLLDLLFPTGALDTVDRLLDE
jgi:kynurenine 3-monooxygenase